MAENQEIVKLSGAASLTLPPPTRMGIKYIFKNNSEGSLLVYMGKEIIDLPRPAELWIMGQ